MSEKILRASAIALALVLLILAVILCAYFASSPAGENTALPIPAGGPWEGFAPEGLTFERVSRTEIKLTWHAVDEIPINRYILQRREAQNGTGTGQWENAGTIEAGEGDGSFSLLDKLDTSSPRQYEYRVTAVPAVLPRYSPASCEPILASNLMVCIDPGHYAGMNRITSEQAYGYAEGDFTLRIAKSLSECLREEYGIDSYLTREDGSITIGGRTDAEVESMVSLRGRYAAKCDSDFFISIHTNANAEDANGYDTCLQPASIGKTLVIMNVLAMESGRAIDAANSIGVNLSRLNYTLGLSTEEAFETASPGDIPQWTLELNDALDAPGAAVCCMANNRDYYGVLRGSALVGVPGVIVEHSFHTTAEMRRQAKETDLYSAWAALDAYGIAYGFGFTETMEKE